MSKRRFGSHCLHREANRPLLPMSESQQKKVKRVGSLRASQVITTYGPGALIDLPRVSAIVASLDTWRPKPNADREIIEPRLTAKIKAMTGQGPCGTLSSACRRRAQVLWRFSRELCGHAALS